jgi:integrase
VRERDRLTAMTVRQLREPGTYHDGAGLYLQIGDSGTKSWLYKFTLNKRTRDMGLGPYPLVSLADARRKRDDAARLRLGGTDPIEARRAEKQSKALAAVNVITFKEAATQYMAAHEDSWRSARHRAQWVESLTSYAYPVLGVLPVADIDIGHVMAVIEPLWKTKTETANRVRQRIELVLHWAATRKYRHGDNPARWRGHIENLLPKRSKVQKVVHHPAMRYGELGAFMIALRQCASISAKALEFTILVAGRTGEVLNARWDDIDLAGRIWTVPPDRMKAGREHRVPLSDAAMSVLEEMMPLRRDGGLVFPGRGIGSPLSHASLRHVLRQLGRSDVTPHGFRSTFKDWATERTNYANEVSEMAIAHAVGSKVELAYRRGDLFEKRRRLMADWATFCATLPAAVTDNVLQLRGSPIPA